MQQQNITSKYLRVRVVAALLVIMVATTLSHLIGHTTHRNVMAKAQVADAFDEALTAVVDCMVRLDAIGVATDFGRADNLRPELRRSLRILRTTTDAIGDGWKQGLLSARAGKLMENATLDPLGQLQDFILVAEALAKPDGPWGAPAVRYVAAARAILSQILPSIRSLKELEREDLEQANASLFVWGDRALGLTALLLVGVGAFIFLPMERRVIEAQEEIRRKQKLAEAASEAKSDFLATMSHEIRTPMNGVLGMAQLLQASDPNDRQRKMIDVINSSGRNLLNIIDDILDFSKIEAEKIELEARSFRLRATAEELCDLLEPQAAKKGLEFRLEVDEALADCHVGDEGRVRQILTNLVGNALKFTKEGAVTLRIAAAEVDGGAQAIRVSVADTGIGITEEQLERVFRLFEQADNTTTRNYGGTGLGLAISIGLAEAMGGGISANSVPGKGSVFTLALTLPARAATLPAPASHSAPPPAVARGARARVLVAEDNEVNQIVITEMLEAANCEVILAGDGEAAVARFDKTQPDLVLMDVSMPGMDGYAATRAIRERERATLRDPTPVIGLTAHVLVEHRAQCLEAGMCMVLTKPVSVADLHRALSDHLPHASLKRSA